MKNKYSCGDLVRIKATGEKGKVTALFPRFNWGQTHRPQYQDMYLLYGKVKGYKESELKPYRPSRTGKFRRANGTFISEKQFAKESAFPPGFNCPVCFKRFSYLEELDKHARIHQPIPTPENMPKMKCLCNTNMTCPIHPTPEKIEKLKITGEVIDGLDKALYELATKVNEIIDRLNK